MTTSRDKWRLESKENKILVENLQQELSSITENRNELITKLESTDSLKKKRNP